MRTAIKVPLPKRPQREGAARQEAICDGMQCVPARRADGRGKSAARRAGTPAVSAFVGDGHANGVVVMTDANDVDDQEEEIGKFQLVTYVIFLFYTSRQTKQIAQKFLITHLQEVFSLYHLKMS